MEQEEKAGVKGDPSVSDSEKIAFMATEIIEPALQKALGEAKERGSPQEILSALANCYSGLLIDLLGAKTAASFMRDHANHIAEREEARLNTE